MTPRTILIFLLIVVPTNAVAKTSGELYRQCLYRYPGATVACDNAIAAILQKNTSSWMKCESAHRASTNDIRNVVLDYLRANPQVHDTPAEVIIKDAVWHAFRCG